jgi:hypothetical protein
MKKNQDKKCNVPLYARYSTQVWAIGVWVFSCDTNFFFSYPWLLRVEEIFAFGKHTLIFFHSTYFLILIISAICEYSWLWNSWQVLDNKVGRFGSPSYPPACSIDLCYLLHWSLRFCSNLITLLSSIDLFIAVSKDLRSSCVTVNKDSSNRCGNQSRSAFDVKAMLTGNRFCRMSNYSLMNSSTMVLLWREFNYSSQNWKHNGYTDFLLPSRFNE